MSEKFDPLGSCTGGLGRIGASELVVENVDMVLICVLNRVSEVLFVLSELLVEFPLSVLVTFEPGVRDVAAGGLA